MNELFEILRVQSTTEVVIALIDFSLVYFVVYQILLLIKGTRAVQILIGLIVVIVFYFLSRNDYWTLPATNWFIDKFIANFIIIVVIIFQSDIRRALAHFGRTTIFSTGYSIEEPQVLEETVAKPLEAALSTTEDVIRIETDVSEGRVGVSLHFAYGTDVDFALQEQPVELVLGGVVVRLADRAREDARDGRERISRAA